MSYTQLVVELLQASKMHFTYTIVYLNASGKGNCGCAKKRSLALFRELGERIATDSNEPRTFYFLTPVHKHQQQA